MMKNWKRWMTAMTALVLTAGMLVGCKGESQINATTSSYEEMVAYLQEENVIAKDASAVNINETAGYLTDNTGGEIPFAAIADEANDYDGVYLFWWNLEEPSELYEMYESMQNNAGVIVYMGGAAILETEAQNGAYAIAFSDDYTNKEQALEVFLAIESE